VGGEGVGTAQYEKEHKPSDYRQVGTARQVKRRQLKPRMPLQIYYYVSILNYELHFL
jgi:hypothetical protein